MKRNPFMGKVFNFSDLHNKNTETCFVCRNEYNLNELVDITITNNLTDPIKITMCNHCAREYKEKLEQLFNKKE